MELLAHFVMSSCTFEMCDRITPHHHSLLSKKEGEIYLLQFFSSFQSLPENSEPLAKPVDRLRHGLKCSTRLQVEILKFLDFKELINIVQTLSRRYFFLVSEHNDM